MAVNKVVFGAVAIMDISDSTVTEETLAEGVTAYDKSGEKITGTMKQSADPKLQAKTATPTTSAQTVKPDSGYDGLSQVTVNAMPTATQATPSITVSSAGLITASATQSAGYVSSGTKSATKQLTTQAAKTVTPTTSNQTAVASGRYTTGAITVKGDANLKADNIKSGVSIFGVAGTYEGSGGSSGGGGSGGGTCSVEIIAPAGVCVFGWGEYDQYISADNGSSWISMGTGLTMPGTGGNSHTMPMYAKYVFANLAVGSVFTFYYANGIKGASVSGDIEFGLANHTTTNTMKHLYGVCRCNGDGTITIQVEPKLKQTITEEPIETESNEEEV